MYAAGCVCRHYDQVGVHCSAFEFGVMLLEPDEDLLSGEVSALVERFPFDQAKSL